MALQVIGAGFGRTGTHCLKLALEQLGFGPSTTCTRSGSIQSSSRSGRPPRVRRRLAAS
jgi:hypothetical protein